MWTNETGIFIAGSSAPTWWIDWIKIRDTFIDSGMLSINKLLGCHFLLVTPVMMAVLDNILLYTRRTHHGANKLSLFYSLFRHSNVGQIKHLHSRLSSLGRFRFFLALSTQSNDSAGNWDRVSIDGMEHMFFFIPFRLSKFCRVVLGKI